ncbi:MAG TPA: VOC family protein [Xanthobacteraceae bacterium]|nr:VOC family protein [Xanthobacteraceae bacterium]
MTQTATTATPAQSATPAATPAGALPRLPQRLHHYAFTVKDQEANRVFWEDVIGVPLTATWCERAYNGTVGREIDYCHTFYTLEDGGALAFFQFADEDAYEALKTLRPEMGQHFAMLVDEATYDAIQQRIVAAGLPLRETDHGYCKSIYTQSPDGLKVEFTIDHPEVEAINAMRLKDCHTELKRWLAGDHRTNNNDRHGITT